MKEFADAPFGAGAGVEQPQSPSLYVPNLCCVVVNGARVSSSSDDGGGGSSSSSPQQPAASSDGSSSSSCCRAAAASKRQLATRQCALCASLLVESAVGEWRARLSELHLRPRLVVRQHAEVEIEERPHRVEITLGEHVVIGLALVLPPVVGSPVACVPAFPC
eukprot:COSAG06_NODE_6929_length_2712_cov_1.758132_3_plen_163_part_00